MALEEKLVLSTSLLQQSGDHLVRQLIAVQEGETFPNDGPGWVDDDTMGNACYFVLLFESGGGVQCAVVLYILSCELAHDILFFIRDAYDHKFIAEFLVKAIEFRHRFAARRAPGG